MNEKKFPYLILERSNSHIEDSDFSENEYKKKKFKIQKYEKFKPKPMINKEQNNKTLKREENKVKYLLSNFLKNIELEENSPRFDYKQINTYKIKDKDKDNISIKKKIKKIDTQNYSNLNRTKSYNSLIISKGRFNDKSISYKNLENVKFGSPKSSLFWINKKHNQKKVGFHINLHNCSHLNNIENRKEEYSKKRSKKNSIKMSSTFKHKKGNSCKIHRNNSVEEYNPINIKPMSVEKGKENFNASNNRGASNKLHLNYIRSRIKKTKSQVGNNNILNFKNEGIILNKRTDKKKKRISFKNMINNFVNNNIFQSKKSKNVIFNDSSLYSESSECNINKKSIDKKLINNKVNESTKKEKNSFISSNNHLTSTIIKKDFSTIVSKKNEVELTDLTNKNSGFKFSIKPKKRNDLKQDNKLFKRSETTIIKNNIKNKSKYQRLNTQYISLKEQIKRSIILRPDEMNLSFEKEDKDSKNNSINKIRNINSLSKRRNSMIKRLNSKHKNSSKSNQNILNIKPVSKFNLGIITKKEDKKNNSNTNIKNIPIIKDSNQITEYTNSTTKLNTQLVPDNINIKKKESSKSISFEDFSMKSIKRKNMVIYQKYRILTHKGIIYDSLDDEEFEDEEDYDSFYVDPHSFFNITFDTILMLSAFVSLIEVPLYLAKSHNFCRRKHMSFIDGLNYIIESLNMIDLFLGFFRAYYNWEEQLVRKNKNIALKYFTGWFIFDLLASIPIYSINKMGEQICNEKELSSSYYNIILDDLHYLFLNNRLFKIIKIFSSNQAWKLLSNKLSDNYSLLINIFLVLAAINYSACLYIFIARNSFPNWIIHVHLETHSFYEIYICAIYVLIMTLTTVGYGDITCYSVLERIFQLLLLVIGIIAYSWLVSSFSNYIKKINERSADYESRKSILDEIKLNNPNLPDTLYDRILRYLKFKNFHERKLKNIIFDCLPVGLKNNLISEMYKPIIKNFLFFKNFQNTDFIVRVILCFKPIMAYKNDILVNEGDMVEDIMFVKRGVLSVELPINMTNPQENVDKYLNMPLLQIEKGPNVQKIGNTTIIQGNNPKMKKMINSINEKDKDKGVNKSKRTNSFNYSFSLNSSIAKSSTLAKRKTEERQKTIETETTYVKILGIRENEHFGDVLMFLEQRSPLRVRVKSKKSELFFLKKMDAVNISTSYQNIWRRINKKSVFNFEQIKKSIRKIVEIYCSVRKINSLNSEENSDSLDNELGVKESLVGVHPKNYDLNNSALVSKKNIIRKNRSLKNYNIRDYKKFFKEDIDNNYFIINNNVVNNKKCCSARLLKKNFDIFSTKVNKFCFSSYSSSSDSSSSSPSIINNKKKNNSNNNKLIDMFQGHYKYYEGIGKINNKSKDEKKAETIISEKTEKESSLNYMKLTNSVHNTKVGKKVNILNTMSIKKLKIEEEINTIHEKDNEDEVAFNKNIQKSKNKSSLLLEWKAFHKDSLIDNTEENLSNKSSYNKDINDEIYPGEVINVFKDDPLLCKKIDFNSRYNSNKNLMEYNTNKLEKILTHNESDSNVYKKKINNEEEDDSSFSEKNEKPEEKNKITSDNNSMKYDSNRNKELNIKPICSSNICLSSINNNKDNSDLKTFCINNNISFQINSSYENINLISGNSLIKNKSLQNKIKIFILDEISNISRFNTNSNQYKRSETIRFLGNKNMFQSTIKPKKRSSCSNIRNSMQLIRKKSKKIIGKNNNQITKRAKTINSNQSLERNSSFYENNAKNKKNNDKFKTGIGPALLGNTIINNFRKKKTNFKGLYIKNTNNNINNYNIINAFNTSNVELQRRISRQRQRRNSIIISSFPKGKKKKDDLLSQINFNIQKTNQNLNNPDEFYSNYFSFLLEGERVKNNQKNDQERFPTSSNDLPKIKKIIGKNKSFINKK